MPVVVNWRRLRVLYTKAAEDVRQMCFGLPNTQAPLDRVHIGFLVVVTTRREKTQQQSTTKLTSTYVITFIAVVIKNLSIFASKFDVTCTVSVVSVPASPAKDCIEKWRVSSELCSVPVVTTRRSRPPHGQPIYSVISLSTASSASLAPISLASNCCLVKSPVRTIDAWARAIKMP